MFNDDYLERTLDPIAPHVHKMWLEIASQARTTALAQSYFPPTTLMIGCCEKSALIGFDLTHNTPMGWRKRLTGNAIQDRGFLFN